MRRAGNRERGAGISLGIRGLSARLRSWLRTMTHRNRLEEEMDSELAFHLEQLTADLVRSGQSPAEAERNARIALGTALTHKEGMRASLGLRWWDEIRTDLRYGLRMLAKSPSFTAIAVLSLSLAIGANTAIVTVAKQLLYAQLHVPHPEQLRLLRWNGDTKVVVHSMWGEMDSTKGGGSTSSVFTYPIYQQLKAHNQVLQDIFAFKENTMNATVRGQARRVEVAMVSGNFYDGIGAHPQIGRAIQASDDAIPGSGTVVVISDGLWEREFNRSPSALGQIITVNQAQMTIIGVNPKGFTGARNVLSSPDLFVPLSMQPVISQMWRTASAISDNNLWWVSMMGRTKPGVPDATAQAALDAQMEAAIRGTMTVAAGDTMPHMDLADGSRGLHFMDGQLKKPVYVLIALTGFVLLLACANIANLLLARGAQRQREMSVRLALGAGRARVLRQLLTESLLLAALGGMGGLLLGYFGRNVLPNLLANPWEENSLNPPVDWVVCGVVSAITLFTGILFGLAPAWLAARVDIGGNLKECAQTTSKRRKGIGGKAIVGFQIALSTLLVVGAGLFLRTLFALNSVDAGFNTDHLLLMEIHPPVARYPAGKDIQLHKQLEERLAAVPGVEKIAPGTEAYLAHSMSNEDFLPEGEAFDPKNRPAEYVNNVGVDFFPLMEIPIVAGRGFNSQDSASSAKVAVINQSLARKRFPNVNPVGKRFRADRDGSKDWIQIVGICADTHYADLRSEKPPQFYMPYLQREEVRGMVYQIRTRMSPVALTPALRRVVQSVDPDLPLIDVRTQREQMDATMQMERTFASLTAGFGILALLLACVGIYGVMAYSVANRRNEIGIRMALGALPGQVHGMILRESFWMACGGILVGVGAALALAKLVQSMLYGVKAHDPLTFAGGAVLLLAVAMLAAWIPARRAAGVEPMEALRHE